ncbi:MAG: hypothetical protein ACI9G1_001051 [Pirellulaceae bacterium]|jgi:hypothetical protein
MGRSIFQFASLFTVLIICSSAVAAQPRPGQRTGRGRPADKLKVGDDAPDFTLKTLDGKAEETLSKYEGKKPVALVFGSYT